MNNYLEYLNIEEIKPYKNNPRKNKESIKYVENSIKEFGFQAPIIVDKKNIIIAGHTRYEAAKNLGYKKIPVIIAKDLDDAKAKAYRIADNSTGMSSSWDFDLLNIEMESVDFNFEDFGLNVESILPKESVENEKEKSEGSDVYTFQCFFQEKDFKKLIKFLEEFKTKNNLENYAECLLKIIKLVKD